MGIPDGAHTHGHGGGGGLGPVVLVIVAVALLGPAAAAAAAALLHALLIAAVVIIALGAAGLVALGAWRLRQARPNTPRVVYQITPAPQRAPGTLSGPRQAIGRGGQLHLHFHGVDAAEVAAIIRNQQEDQ